LFPRIKGHCIRTFLCGSEAEHFAIEGLRCAEVSQCDEGQQAGADHQALTTVPVGKFTAHELSGPPAAIPLLIAGAERPLGFLG
jgi:hypothetical protein